MNHQHPPKFFLRFFKWFCDPELHPFIEGDLLELYRERSEEVGKKKADRRFVQDVFLLFRPGVVRNLQINISQNALDMFRHNILITFRNFKRNKTSFLINLFGLATGLACVLMIYLWVSDEWKMDKFHENDARLYQIMQNFERINGIVTDGITPANLAGALKEEIPEVEYAVSINNRYYFYEDGILSDGDNHLKARGIYAGKDYFNVFSYPLAQGDKNLALADKNSLAISKSLAQKIFNSTDDVIGKTIEWEHKIFDWGDTFLEGVFQISGVFEDPPPSSTAQFDLVFNYDLLMDKVDNTNDWNTDAADTYVILKEGADVESFNEKITDLLRSKHEHRKYCSLFAQQYSTRYLYGRYENGAQAGGRIAYVKLFSIIALFLLVIACINFVNLSTAKASTRLKEVGVKKVSGASRKALIIQFLQESVVLVFLSTFIAFLLSSLLLPRFNEITGKQLQLNLDGGGILALASIVLLTGLAAGSYPAFYLSGFKPASVLKGKLKISLGEQWVRRGLVLFQFTLSIIFIAGFIILHKQLEFIQKKQLGYNQDNIVAFASKGKTGNKVESFMLGLKDVPGVAQATNIWGGSLMKNKNFSVSPSWEGQGADEAIIVPRPHVGYDFIETLGIELIEGRSFSRKYGDEESKIILNEAAVKLIGYENPIGRTLTRGSAKLEIIGIVKDFHNESLHEEIKPTFIRFLPGGKDVMVKIKAGEEVATIKRLKDYYESFHPGFSFEFTFMDAAYQSLYEAEKRVASLSNYFAGVAIIISCLGLFGLAVFTSERRKKEIGIRIVLGASVFGIVKLLTGDFTKTVIAAIIIATPVSYLIAESWLTGFAYKMDLKWGLFLLPGLSVLLIAWCTVGLQTIKAARANPAESLKNE